MNRLVLKPRSDGISRMVMERLMAFDECYVEKWEPRVGWTRLWTQGCVLDEETAFYFAEKYRGVVAPYVNVRVVDAYGSERRQGVSRDLPVAIDSVGGISMEIMGLEPTTWPTYGGLKRGKE